MEKLLTIIVPIYNTEQYLPKCLGSLIITETLMPQVEVLLIIDGSPDGAITIAREFEKKYPQTFVVINKENGGYGSVLKRGIKEAKGKYCKVLDSDDWYDTKDFKTFVEELQTLDADVVVTDFVKEFVFEDRTELQTLPKLQNRKSYDLERDINSLEGDIFVMHRLAYKTEVLRRAGIDFPEKVFYTDTLFASIPLFFAKDLYYTNLRLYRYFIGREGQTVAPETVRKNRKSVETVIKYYYEKFLKDRETMTENKKAYTLKSIKTLFGIFYRTLHHLPFSDAKKDLAAWHRYVKGTPDAEYFLQNKMIRSYGRLPYAVFRYASFLWK